MNEFVENYTLSNCYIDTTFYDSGSGNLITSKFSNDTPQIAPIKDYLVVVADTGYKLNNTFSFDFQLQEDGNFYDPVANWLTLTQDDFLPLENTLNLTNLYLDKWDFQLAGKNLDNSLVATLPNDLGYIFLLGGFDENKLVFRWYTFGSEQSNEGLYGSQYINGNSFTNMWYDEYWNEIGEITVLNNLTFSATPQNEDIDPNVSESFFATYYLGSDTIEDIKRLGSVPTDLIINTYSYPLKFDDSSLVDAVIKITNVATEIDAKAFLKNSTRLDIFSFTVPDLPDVIECYIRLPFNDNITLDYSEIQHKTITGYITYEVLTNTTTLFIDNGDYILYKNEIDIASELPYKPTGVLKGYSGPKTRGAFEKPKLYIKYRGETIKGNFIKGVIKEPITNILKNELDILNELLKEGIYINE